jgi:hypothetical protein
MPEDLDQAIELLVELKKKKEHAYTLMWFIIIGTALLIVSSIWNGLVGGEWWFLTLMASVAGCILSYKTHKSYKKISHSYARNRAAIDHVYQ